eukprot:Hpha_TRINITY_DN16747_c3_g7::TRINITY_DN16747_c3_g7_i1::g.76061::m.76061
MRLGGVGLLRRTVLAPLSRPAPFLPCQRGPPTSPLRGQRRGCLPREPARVRMARIREKERRREEEERMLMNNDKGPIVDDAQVEAWDCQGWDEYSNMDCFSGQNVWVMPATDLNEVKRAALARRYGAFVVWLGKAYFRAQSPQQCRKNLVMTYGPKLWITRANVREEEEEPMQRKKHEDGWEECDNTDAFGGENAWHTDARDLERCKSICKEKRWGGFVVWLGRAYFRRRLPGDLRDGSVQHFGSTMWIAPDEVCEGGPMAPPEIMIQEDVPPAPQREPARMRLARVREQERQREFERIEREREQRREAEKVARREKRRERRLLEEGGGASRQAGELPPPPEQDPWDRLVLTSDPEDGLLPSRRGGRGREREEEPPSSRRNEAEIGWGGRRTVEDIEGGGRRASLSPVEERRSPREEERPASSRGEEDEDWGRSRRNEERERQSRGPKAGGTAPPPPEWGRGSKEEGRDHGSGPSDPDGQSWRSRRTSDQRREISGGYDARDSAQICLCYPDRFSEGGTARFSHILSGMGIEISGPASRLRLRAENSAMLHRAKEVIDQHLGTVGEEVAPDQNLEAEALNILQGAWIGERCGDVVVHGREVVFAGTGGESTIDLDFDRRATLMGCVVARHTQNCIMWSDGEVWTRDERESTLAAL